MLRLLVLLLVLANAGFYAWAHGLLLAWGLGPAQQSEPQRLAQQLQPQALRVLPASALRRAEAPASAPAPAAAAAPAVAASGPPASASAAQECLASAVLPPAQSAALQPVLLEWPQGSWRLEPANEPARWIIYMGRYADQGELARKREQLRGLGVPFEPVGTPELAPGLSLGAHATEAAAARQLEVLGTRGVRTARVVRERAEVLGQRLVLPAVDEALRPRLADLTAVLDGTPLRPCR